MLNITLKKYGAKFLTLGVSAGALIFSQGIAAQSVKQAVDPALERTIAQLTKQLIIDANKRSIDNAVKEKIRLSEAWRYQPLNTQSKRADLDRDGDLDAVVLISICEKDSCHPTSNEETIFLLRKDSNIYSLNKKMDLKFKSEIVSIVSGTVTVSTLSYGDNDPTCCPSKRSVLKLSMRKP